MDNNGIGIADVAALSGGLGNNFGGFEGLIYLAVIAAMFGGGFGGFGFGGNNGGVAALNADMQRGFDTQNLQAQTRDILGAVTNGTAQTIAASTANATNAINAIKDGNAALIREFGTVETALTALSGKQQECCCDIKQLVLGTSAATDAAIASAKYETAMQMAGMEARLTAKMDANEITSLRDKVQKLELEQATSGVLRYPNSWSYGAGPFPPLYGCCNGNI